MNAPAVVAPLPAAFFHEDSGSVRCWVDIGTGQPMGAIVRPPLLHHRFGAAMDGSDALSIYLTHRVVIDDAVRRRAAAGALEPVLLRESDLGPRPH